MAALDPVAVAKAAEIFRRARARRLARQTTETQAEADEVKAS